MKLAISSALLAPHLCGSAPPRGTDVSVGLGAGRHTYERGGCGAPIIRYEAAELRGHLQARHRVDNGLVVAAEAGGSRSKTVGATPNRPIPPSEQSWIGGYTALRIGYRGDFFGFTLGPSVVYAEGEYLPLPSAKTWIGPDYLYVYGDLASGPFGRTTFPVGAGFGTAHDRFRLSGGVVGGEETQVRLRTEFLLTNHIWAGLDASIADDDNMAAFLTIGAEWAAPPEQR